MGYNTLVGIRKIMLGDDKDRRFKAQAEELVNNEDQDLKKSGTQAMEAHQQLMNDQNRTKELTGLHYRKYYKDELENCRSLFPAPVF